MTLASSSDPMKNSDPGRAPITRSAEFEIDPIFGRLEAPARRRSSAIDVAVFTHWIVCHSPSSSAGPAMISLEPCEPM